MASNKWTVMLYLASDNELSDDMLAAVSQLEARIRTHQADTDVRFFAFYDPLATGFPALLYDFSNYELEKLNYEIRTSKDSIFEFVEWCVNKLEDKDERKYALILSGHGDGFQKKSFLNDQASDSSVTIGELRYILDQINEHRLPNKLSILGLDSCVMSSIEFAYEMRNAAEVLVASQGYVPFAGWDYADLFEKISREGDISVDKMAGLMMNAFIDSYTPFCDHNGLSVEIASCRLEGIEKLQEQVHRFADEVTKLLVSEDGEMTRKTQAALLLAHHKCQTHLLDQCADLADFVDQFMQELGPLGVDTRSLTDLTESAKAIVDDLSSRARTQWVGEECQFSRGLSIYYPWSFFSYLNNRDYYLSLNFGGEREKAHLYPKSWTTFLDTYLFTTLRDDADSNLKKKIIRGLESGNNGHEIPTGGSANLLNPLEAKLNPLTSKLNPLGSKVNPLTSRVNPMTSRVLQQVQLENFRRTRNHPWMPEQAFDRLLITLPEKESRGTPRTRKRNSKSVREKAKSHGE